MLAVHTILCTAIQTMSCPGKASPVEPQQNKAISEVWSVYNNFKPDMLSAAVQNINPRISVNDMKDAQYWDSRAKHISILQQRYQYCDYNIILYNCSYTNRAWANTDTQCNPILLAPTAAVNMFHFPPNCRPNNTRIFSTFRRVRHDCNNYNNEAFIGRLQIERLCDLSHNWIVLQYINATHKHSKATRIWCMALLAIIYSVVIIRFQHVYLWFTTIRPTTHCGILYRITHSWTLYSQWNSIKRITNIYSRSLYWNCIRLEVGGYWTQHIKCRPTLCCHAKYVAYICSTRVRVFVCACTRVCSASNNTRE